MLRLLSGVKLPWRASATARSRGDRPDGAQDLRHAPVASTSDNTIYLGFALVAGLLVWLNFISRVILVSAAWAANDLDTGAARRASAPGRWTSPSRDLTPMPVVSIRERTDAGLPTFGQRAADRTSVAAGAVLGALGAVAVGTSPAAYGAWSAASDLSGDGGCVPGPCGGGSAGPTRAAAGPPRPRRAGASA